LLTTPHLQMLCAKNAHCFLLGDNYAKGQE
jgi:hypothetical protein